MREFRVGSDHYNWSEIGSGEPVPIRAEYQSLHGRLCKSAVKLEKDSNGHPRIVEGSFVFWREKGVFEIPNSKFCSLIKKLFSKK